MVLKLLLQQQQQQQQTHIVESVSEIDCRCRNHKPLKGMTDDTPLNHSEQIALGREQCNVYSYAMAQ
jgi:aerobic-type carbon monoxide dehydrogenase small subunit (CoxS/CutS family)